MSKATIWNALKQKTSLTDEAISGLMGNLYAESNCEACRVQGDFTADRRVSKQYAQNVNSGVINEQSFMYDAKGWGLPQFTFWSRKQGLLQFCRNRGVGIEDEEAQIDYMLQEFQTDFAGAWNSLMLCKDIYEAARIVCEQYERPAVNNVVARADYGRTIYNEFHGTDPVIPDPEPAPGPALSKKERIIALLEQLISILKEE